MESELTDALATSARAMPRLRSGPHHLHSKDVPHLSESVFIGIERWRFVESLINEFARMMNPSLVFDRQSVSAGSEKISVPVSCRQPLSPRQARVARCHLRRERAKAPPRPVAGRHAHARVASARASANS